jgi:UDP-2,3-diacylglucosamine pyrophosphatase LpxH
MAPRTFRAIFISDFHLGTKACRAGCLLDFLRHHESQTLYLVGDIVDGWMLKRGWYWNQDFNDVVQKLLRKARKGTQITYIPGNHDAFAREYAGYRLGDIRVERQAMHRTVDGRNLLVMHGDEFDGVVTHARWLATLGSHAYNFSIAMNCWLNAVRRKLGYPYWSLSAYLKYKVKNAVMFMDDFEQLWARETKRQGADGIVCGHIHRASIRELDGITYYNCGDWVESCTALVEHHDGSMELIQWHHERPQTKAVKIATPAAPPLPVPI